VQVRGELTRHRCFLDPALHIVFDMGIRSFTDEQGTAWRVWSTQPSTRTVLGREFASGWLTFQCEDGLRRLAPIPRDWEEASIERLRLMCRVAAPVKRTTPKGTPITEVENDSRDP
jgi:hypothetical protein